MRSAGVKASVSCESWRFFLLRIEHTSTEAAEQPPAQERGPRRRPGPRTIPRRSRCPRRSPDQSWRLRVRGADGSRATSIRAGGDAPDTRDLFVKPGSERPFYTTVHK